MHKLQIVLLLFILFLSPVAFCASTEDIIMPGDRIRIWVKGEPDLTVERVVGKDGTISYPLLGNVKVDNLKPHKAAGVIARLLDDGYLKQPLVEVEILSRSGDINLNTDTGLQKSVATDLSISKSREPTTSQVPNKIIQIVNGKTGEGIGNAALFAGGKIYQSNGTGQILVDNISGRIIVLADGYNTLQGPAERLIQPGNPPKIALEKITLVDEVTIKVIDASTKTPLQGVYVKLDGTVVKTNAQGLFRIKEIGREFAEIRLEMPGYKPLRKILDFKIPGERVIAMEHYD